MFCASDGGGRTVPWVEQARQTIPAGWESTHTTADTRFLQSQQPGRVTGYGVGKRSVFESPPDTLR